VLALTHKGGTPPRGAPLQEEHLTKNSKRACTLGLKINVSYKVKGQLSLTTDPAARIPQMQNPEIYIMQRISQLGKLLN
jgi:hypothetical protein